MSRHLMTLLALRQSASFETRYSAAPWILTSCILQQLPYVVRARHTRTSATSSEALVAASARVGRVRSSLSRQGWPLLRHLSRTAI
eukprot:6182756-Pleurochrysis_carterae.AAC.1